MNDKLLDILKEHDDLSEQQLLDYLKGNLSAEERHEIEMRLSDHEMMSDAEEGLKMIDKKEDLNAITAQLNARLTEQLRTRRKKKLKEMPNQSFIILTAFIILVLVVIAFMVIYKMQRR
ncbi:MAG: hypothetical protein K2X48_19055 [Chitinophagaceae bacterium]|nr:hypothetical protein [Chitinophagaceae bacterium]